MLSNILISPIVGCIRKLVKREAVNYEGNTFGDFKVYDNFRKDFNNVGCKKINLDKR